MSNRDERQKATSDAYREGMDKIRLDKLAREMRKVAEPVGSMHAWWELIISIEYFLEGKPQCMHPCDAKLSASELIERAEKYFIDAKRVVP